MDTIRLPIYPSAEVIFPGQMLLVRRTDGAGEQMIRFCRERHHPLGAVLVSDAAGHSLARIGTLAYLLDPHVSTEGDDVNVLAAGQSRFRILQIHQDCAYLEATVRLWPWVEEPRPDWFVVERLGSYLHRYITALSDVLPPTVMPEALFPDSATLGILGAALLPLSAAEKQRLLEMPTSQALLCAVLDSMRIYVPVAERVAATRPRVMSPYECILFN